MQVEGVGVQQLDARAPLHRGGLRGDLAQPVPATGFVVSKRDWCGRARCAMDVTRTLASSALWMGKAHPLTSLDLTPLHLDISNYARAPLDRGGGGLQGDPAQTVPVNRFVLVSKQPALAKRRVP